MPNQNQPRGADADAQYRQELHQAAAGRDRAPGMGRADDTGSAEAPRGNLDKTLSHIKAGLPAGPERTPGGVGQVWKK